MPEFSEIFQTKENMAQFTKEYLLLVNCNTSMDDAKEQFMRALKALKAVCEVVSPHENSDKAVTVAAQTFRAACNDPDYFSDFIRDIEKLAKAVQLDVDTFLADGRTPADVADRERMYSEKELEAIRERARLEEKTAKFSGLQLKEQEEERRKQEEIREHQRLIQKEKELLMKTTGRPTATTTASKPSGTVSPKPTGISKSTSSNDLLDDPPSQRRSAAELLRDIEKMRLEQPKTETVKSSNVSSSSASNSTVSRSQYSSSANEDKPNRHRFTEFPVTLPTKCKFCKDHILFGKGLKCDKCSSIIHRKCETPNMMEINGCRETF